jgi:amino acid adenylation domain-containing protein
MSSPVASPEAFAPDSLSGPQGDVFVFPASFAQQRLWFIDQYDPGSTAYCLPILLEVRGPLDAEILARSLAEILRRHEILRTTFSLRQWEIVQVVSPDARLDFSIEDFSGIPEGERERRLAEAILQESRRPFDLRQGPLFRVRLWRVSEHEHRLLLDLHHIVADGWSFSVLLRELALLYGAFWRGEASPLPEPRLQYADFSLWQRERMRDPRLHEQLARWKKSMEGAPPVLELHADRPRPPRQTFAGAYETELLPADLTRRIRSLARRERVTPFMALLAAFYALLYRHTGQSDLVVATPIANRTLPDLEPLIGLFMNTLILRTDLSGNPTFLELLRRVAATCLDAYANPDIPFERLVEVIRPPRDASRNPVFQVMFVHQKAFIQPFEVGDVRFEPIRASRGGALADLALFVIEREEGFTAGLEHNTDLFDTSTIRRLLGHLRTLLEAVVENPSVRLDAIPLLTAAERRQLLVEWNRTEAEFPREKCAHRLFEEQVEKTPAAVAVALEEEAWTYAELNARANRLARHLARLGVGLESRVAILMARGPEMVVALLAVWKAGGAYVPLDPSHPAERLELLLEDAAPSIVLTHAGAGRSIPFRGTVVNVDSLDLPGSPEIDADPSTPVGAENLAYLIYTSGSTGRPKGTMVPHRSLVNYLTWCRTAYPVTGGGRVPVQSSLGVDLTVTSLLAPLVSGAAVRLLPEAPAASALPALLERSGGWSLIKLTPGELELAAAQLSASTASGCAAALVVGGESLNAESLTFWRQSSPATRIFNEYGPTETVVGCCVYDASRSPLEGPVPIGRPIANTRLYVLDGEGQPVPIGVVGELCIAGEGVARGYWKLPDLTAQKFVPDPFGPPGTRMYRSGDFARYRSDGNLEYVGRRDLQVKLRGHRVELAEIESALSRHASVRGAAVVVREDPPGARKLVAYVEAGGASATASDLRNFLKERLPPHMIPAVIHVEGRLPRTDAGKVDRRALAAAPSPGLDPSPAGVPPRDEVERRLAAIWQEVLAVAEPGIHDDYFDLGGHSLLAVRLFSRIADVFGRQLPLGTIFQAPTIARLAELLRKVETPNAGSSIVVIQAGGSLPPFFCVPGVGGNVVGYSDLARHLGPDQPVYGLQAPGLDGIGEPLSRVEDMASLYVREIRACLPEGPFLLGGASFGGRVAFEMARQLESMGSQVHLVALFDAFAPGIEGPSLRARSRGYAARIAYHGRNVLFGARRRDYVVRKSRTILRRLKSRLWQAVHASYQRRSKPLPRILQDVREAGYLANRRYRAQPYGGRVVLFRAGVRSAADALSADMGWSRFAKGGVEIREVPGDHVDMLLKPQVVSLAQQLRECLARAAPAASAGQSRSAGAPRGNA